MIDDYSKILSLTSCTLFAHKGMRYWECHYLGCDGFKTFKLKELPEKLITIGTIEVLTKDLKLLLFDEHR